MQELRSKEFSSPGVQELRSLAGQRFRRPGVQQEARSSGAQLFRNTGVSEDGGSVGQEFMGSASQEARSFWGQSFRGPGVPEAGCSGVWQEIRGRLGVGERSKVFEFVIKVSEGQD